MSSAKELMDTTFKSLLKALQEILVVFIRLMYLNYPFPVT